MFGDVLFELLLYLFVLLDAYILVYDLLQRLLSKAVLVVVIQRPEYSLL